MPSGGRIRIGLAGWSESLARRRADFPAGGAGGLARYAAVFDFVEINATFYRRFRTETCAKWAAEVPGDFRFAVKMPRQVTHFTRLKDPGLLGPFFDSVGGLGGKLSVVLVQLPPTLAFDPVVAAVFFDALRGRHDGAVVCEPRHASWKTPEALRLLAAHRIGLVCTEIPGPAERPVRGRVPVYVRLHGAPRRYYSAYGNAALARLADFLRRNPRRERFVVFDNTAAGAAVGDAVELRRLLGPLSRRTAARLRPVSRKVF